MPVPLHYGGGVHGVDKALNQVFFTAELDTGVDGAIYSPQNLLVLAVGRMELFG